MNPTEAILRSIKDRVATAMGILEEAAPDAYSKENHRRLSSAARELHQCANEMQNILMRIKPK